MRKLSVTLCLTFAVLLGSGEVRGSDLPVCEGSPKEGRTAADIAEWDNCQGTVTSGGSKYVGEFRDGIREGQGTYTYPSGAKYVGEYRDGTRNGQGSYTWPNGPVKRNAFGRPTIRTRPLQHGLAWTDGGGGFRI